MLSRRTSWVAAGAFWIVFGLLSALQVWISMITHGHSLPRLIGYYVLLWTPWLPFSALIAWVSRRKPVTRRTLGMHASLAVGFGVTHSYYSVAMTRAVRPFDAMTELFRKPLDVAGFILAQLPIEVILYGLVIAALLARDHYRRYREHQLRTAELEASLTQARLRALELQIQPHFLFNTLNAVSSLVRGGKPQEAVIMIAGLSDLLRYTLDHSGSERVTLGEETAMLRRYLEIQRARFPDRLTFAIDVPAELRDAAVPTLILQPLAENAVRHGIATSAEEGRIDVRAFRDNGHLRIEVFNSGVLRKSAEGIGLRNTRERLRQLYGEDQALELRDRGDGVLASIAIPWAERA